MHLCHPGMSWKCITNFSWIQPLKKSSNGPLQRSGQKTWITSTTWGFLKTLPPLALHSDWYVMCLANLCSHHHSCLFNHFFKSFWHPILSLAINIYLYQLAVNFERCNTFPHEKPNYSTNFMGPNSQCYCHHTSINPMCRLSTVECCPIPYYAH